MQKPKVSIITPVYNSSCFIEETILSVLRQSYSNWEMVIVDDSSTDQSVVIIEQYVKRDQRFILIKNELNIGPGPSRNTGIKVATGRIIAFLDSDDMWHPNKLQIQVEFMLYNKIALSHTSYGFLDEQSNIIKSTFCAGHKPITYKKLLKGNVLGCSTVMYDTKFIGKMYMPNLRIRQDYALWLKILKKGFQSFPINKELAYYRQVNGSISSNKWKLILFHWAFLYKRERLGFWKSMNCFTHWAISGIFKYYIK